MEVYDTKAMLAPWEHRPVVFVSSWSLLGGIWGGI